MTNSVLTDIAVVREALANCKAKTNEQWLASLNERKREESRFHDAYRLTDANPDQGTGQAAANCKYYSIVRASSEYESRWLAANAKGKVFLDYACGSGGSARPCRTIHAFSA